MAVLAPITIKEATALPITKETLPAEIAHALRLPMSRPVLLVLGGARDMTTSQMDRLRALFAEAIAPVAVEARATVIDGGTQAGVMQLMGEAYAAARGDAPLVGVCPRACVIWPNERDTTGRSPLEPNHTHFVLTPGTNFGDETPTLFSLAAKLSADTPSLALLVNGGDIARKEALLNVRDRRELVVIAGSGRLADHLTAVLTGAEQASHPDIVEIVRDGRITLFGIGQPPSSLAELLRASLAEPGPAQAPERVTFFSWLPRLRWRPGPQQHLVPLHVQRRHSEFGKDFACLETELMKTFRECDNQAMDTQNQFRLEQLALIVGTTAINVLGVMQFAFLHVPWWGLFASIIAAITATIALRGPSINAQRRYFTARLKAEILRGEYFLYLGRLGEYASGDDNQCTAVLRGRVADVMRET